MIRKTTPTYESRQIWYINKSAIKIFKWTTNILGSLKFPIVSIWVSFPYLPIHFIYCKEALYSIASAISKPLRIDQATASLSRPSVARVLVKHDVIQPSLQQIRIGMGNSGFWSKVNFEKIPLYSTMLPISTLAMLLRCVVLPILGFGPTTKWGPTGQS